MTTLTAIYDLGVSPASYDFVGFLVAAERRRREGGHSEIHLNIVHGPVDGFRRDNLPPYTAAARLKMRQNVVEPMCRLLPALTLGRVIDRLSVACDGAIFPEDWTPMAPTRRYSLVVMVQNAKAGIFPLVAPRKIELPPHSITMTLREASRWPARNSNRANWLAAARNLATTGWNVIIVPDAESPPIPNGPWTVTQAASVDLLQRAALYEAAEQNLFVNNGPAWMAAFMSRVNSIIMRMEGEQAPCVSDEYFASCGLPRGSQLGNPRHRIAWSDESPQNIVATVGKPKSEAGPPGDKQMDLARPAERPVLKVG